MKKYFLFLLLLNHVRVHAQNDNILKSNFSLSVALKNQLPIHVFKRGYSYGVGGMISADLKVFKNFAFVIRPGYMRYFFNQKVSGISGSTGYIILPGGLKYKPVEKIYLTASAGVGIKTSKFGKESAFAYSGGAGYFVAKNIDVEFEYSKGNGSTLAPENVGLNVAYTFFRNRHTNRR